MKIIAACAVYVPNEEIFSIVKRSLNRMMATDPFQDIRVNTFELVISNNSPDKPEVAKFLSGLTEDNFNMYGFPVKVITNEGNIGTAAAVNRAWATRRPEEGFHYIKFDPDILIEDAYWPSKLGSVVEADPTIGQVGLKRPDLIENPAHPDPFYRSELYMLPKKDSSNWQTVEIVNHVMGTCVLHSNALITKVGGLLQPGFYGVDDSLMSFRSQLAGFKNAFLCNAVIHHIDNGTTSYQKDKEAEASSNFTEYHAIRNAMSKDLSLIYHNIW